MKPAYADTSAKDLQDSVDNVVDSFGGKGLARKKEQIEVFYLSKYTPLLFRD